MRLSKDTASVPSDSNEVFMFVSFLFMINYSLLYQSFLYGISITLILPSNIQYSTGIHPFLVFETYFFQRLREGFKMKFLASVVLFLTCLK